MSATAFEPVDWAVLGASGAQFGSGGQTRRQGAPAPPTARRSPCSAAGVTVLFALAACLHSVPWRRGGGKDATRSFSILWRGRAVLALMCAATAVRRSLLRVKPPPCCASRQQQPLLLDLQHQILSASVAVCLPSASCCAVHVTSVQASQLLRLGVLWGANSVVFSPGITSWTSAGWMCRWDWLMGQTSPQACIIVPPSAPVTCPATCRSPVLHAHSACLPVPPKLLQDIPHPLTGTAAAALRLHSPAHAHSGP